MRERLGDPRVVPNFHCTFLPGMPSSPSPGSPTSICSRTSMPTWPSPFDHRLGTPKTPAIRSTRVSHFVASLVRFRYGLPGCSRPLCGSDWIAQPSGTFTSRLSTDQSPSPLLDNYNSSWISFCWRDLHPLEWQLASLHDQRATRRLRSPTLVLPPEPYIAGRPGYLRKVPLFCGSPLRMATNCESAAPRPSIP